MVWVVSCPEHGALYPHCWDDATNVRSEIAAARREKGLPSLQYPPPPERP
jgi:hypothetical protein